MWEYGACDSVQEFIAQKLSLESVSAFLDFFELNSFQMPDAIRSASSLVLVYYEKEHNYTSDDLAWLSYAPAAAICRGEHENIMFIELDSCDEEYYIAAAAIIKLLNIAFPDDNLYVFKSERAVAFGCKRFLDDSISDNFCITKLFSEEELDECASFLEEAVLSGRDLLSSIISDFSPQEHHDNAPVENCRRKSEDYIHILYEIRTLYGIDTTNEYLHYVATFNQEKDEGLTYEETCSMLRYIGESNDETSYDVLDEASQEKIIDVQEQNDEISKIDKSDLDLNYSEEAFSDAEQLLKEMLERDCLSTEI